MNPMPFDGQPEKFETTDDTVKVLLDAAQLIRERGLARGEGTDAQGRLCAIGALYVARLGTFSDTISEAAKTLGAFLGISPERIYIWSDNARDASEVIAALEGAAARRALSLKSSAERE